MAPVKAKKTRVKQQSPEFPVPQTRDQVVHAIAEIGIRQRDRERLEVAMNDELAVIKQRYEEAAAPHIEAIKLLSQGVQIWCEAHRKELTDDGKTKTATLGSGTVAWRMNPPKVVLKGIENILAAFKKLGLDRFIRTKEEVNKEAILVEPEAVKAVPGIKIEQNEEFVITPFEAELQKAV